MDSFSTRLLTWYDNHARTLPWRISPQDGKQGILPDPYHVWLSEVMLQQTTVATVGAYFIKFIDKWPTVKELAAASSEDVMKAWAGLGYYSRARNLKACADIIAEEHGGKFPQTQAELLKLPGIGDYTSAAIAAIAFGQKTAVVDGNIERVCTRFTENATPLPSVKQECRDLMGDITPEARPGDFVQAMMDLGATICTPKKPTCAQCPLNADCQSYAAGTMLDYPVKLPKKPKPTRVGAAFILLNNEGDIWLSKRPDKGLLGGMTGVPTTQWTASKDGKTGAEAGPLKANWSQHPGIRHTFTHFHLELEVWVAETAKPPIDGWWSARHEISEEALPTLMKKVIASAMPEIFKPKKPN